MEKKNGIAINVKGDIGIQLTLNYGKKILIGTQNRDVIDGLLNRYLNKI